MNNLEIYTDVFYWLLFIGAFFALVYAVILPPCIDIEELCEEEKIFKQSLEETYLEEDELQL
jgi:hypothetical protein